MTLLTALVSLAILLVVPIALWATIERTDMTRAKGTLAYGLTAGIGVMITSAVILFWFAEQDRSEFSDSWETTTGTITEVTDLSITEPGAAQMWEFTFEYSVDDEYYIDTERRTGEDFARNDSVTVHYDHDEPDVAHLVEPEYDDDTARAFEIVAAALLTLAGLLTAYVITQIVAARKTGTEPAA